MTPAARLSAAIDILADIEARHRPAADALKDWGLSHRFAGSSDRAAIASLVYDCLRRRSSARYLADGETARATLLGALRLHMPVDEIAALFSGERFAPEPLTQAERQALETRQLEDAPPCVQADIPGWLWGTIAQFFKDDAIAEGQALAERAPVDLRANTLKTSREELLSELGMFQPRPTPYSPVGLRIAGFDPARRVSVQTEPAFQKGWFEVQDEGSQLAALLTLAKPGEQVLDLCAGSGGKTLALAAMMQNTGRIIATDTSMHRLAPIHKRLEAAGAGIVEVRSPRGGVPVADLKDRMDLVLVDAPCTGAGTWRRNPDAKWRLTPKSLIARKEEQAEALAAGASCVKPGGRLVYVTCSILTSENDMQVDRFLEQFPGFAPMPAGDIARDAGLASLSRFVTPKGLGIMLTPHRSNTDGFYIAALRRKG